MQGFKSRVDKFQGEKVASVPQSDQQAKLVEHVHDFVDFFVPVRGIVLRVQHLWNRSATRHLPVPWCRKMLGSVSWMGLTGVHKPFTSVDLLATRPFVSLLEWEQLSSMATCLKQNSKFSILQSLGLFGSC